MHNDFTRRIACLGVLGLLSTTLLLGGCRSDMTVPDQPPQPPRAEEPMTRPSTTRMSAAAWASTSRGVDPVQTPAMVSRGTDPAARGAA